jgi:putative ABC transport system permease protein
MAFGTLVLTALTRNPLRFLFTFAAVAAAFCLFGVLETLRYEREAPPDEGEELIIVQAENPGGFPLDYEATILAMPGVAAATGAAVAPAVNPRSPTENLILFGLNAAQTPSTLTGMKIPPEVAKRWLETRIGAISDAPTAKDMGWKPNDSITLQLPPGFTTGSGSNRLELILVGVYPGRSVVGGIIIRDDYLREAFPFSRQLGNVFVRPARPGEAQDLANRIDAHFQAGAHPTLSAPLSDFRESARREASTIRLLIRGAIAIAFFTMVLIVANALMQSVRERFGEMAVMQALGFQERTILLLVFAEVFVLFGTGAAFGLILANVGFAFEIAGSKASSTILPWHTIGWTVFYVTLFALLAALLPGWELSRMRVADALRRL